MRITRTVIAAAAALAIAAATAGAASRSSSYNDPAGDNGTAPDITAVQVFDDASGQITFQVQTPGTQDLSGDRSIGIPIDADQNASTGATNVGGAEYFFVLDEGGWSFARWNGSDWDFTTPHDTVHVRFSGGLSFSVNRSELGGTGAFSFFVRTITGDSNVGHVDDAPDSGTWSYTLTGGAAPAPPPATTNAPTTTAPAPAPPPAPAPAPAPTIKSLVVPSSSLFPAAGKTFRFVVSSVRLSTSALVAPTTVTCKAKLAGRALAGSGKGGCTWLLAKTSRRKPLVVRVTAVYRGAAMSQTFPLRVA